MKLESTLQTALLLEAPQSLPELRLFRRNIVAARYGEHTVRAGIPGQCDLYGYLRNGRVIEIELKSATGTSSDDQKRWASWCSEWGVLHLTLKAKKNETVQETVARWIAEIRAVIS